MKPLSLIMIILGSVAVATCASSCSTVERVATPENLGRALVIYDEARLIGKNIIFEK